MSLIVNFSYSVRYILCDILGSVNGKQVIKILRQNGFKESRVSGSHHILSNGSLKVTVPVHGATDLKIGTLKSIEKHAGVKLI